MADSETLVLIWEPWQYYETKSHLFAVEYKMVLHKVLFFFYFLIIVFFLFSSELIVDLFSAQPSSSLSVNLNHGVISVEVYGLFFFLVLYTGAMSDSSVLPHHNRVYSFIAVCKRTCVCEIKLWLFTPELEIINFLLRFDLFWQQNINNDIPLY